MAAGNGSWTLCATDLASGRIERLPVMGKGERGIVAALEQIRTQRPVPLLGVHPDNGSEFLNSHRLRYGQRTGVALSRSRPGHNNDNAHIEQKNWILVRRWIGYQRLDTPAQLAWFAALSTDLLRPFTNCFQPVIKLVRRETVGSRRREGHDRPTPWPVSSPAGRGPGHDPGPGRALRHRHPAHAHAPHRPPAGVHAGQLGGRPECLNPAPRPAATGPTTHTPARRLSGPEGAPHGPPDSQDSQDLGRSRRPAWFSTSAPRPPPHDDDGSTQIPGCGNDRPKPRFLRD
ncbi:MAG TPA: hypothetical protein VMW47_06685 [Verrucomicrobiae bacterium]|nr:hypothetical protein [Verrucomicrobiae bacterium]